MGNRRGSDCVGRREATYHLKVYAPVSLMVIQVKSEEGRSEGGLEYYGLCKKDWRGWEAQIWVESVKLNEAPRPYQEQVNLNRKLSRSCGVNRPDGPDRVVIRSWVGTRE